VFSAADGVPLAVIGVAAAVSQRRSDCVQLDLGCEASVGSTSVVADLARMAAAHSWYARAATCFVPATV
jgi:hypothetical protein